MAVGEPVSAPRSRLPPLAESAPDGWTGGRSLDPDREPRSPSANVTSEAALRERRSVPVPLGARGPVAPVEG